jgi:hypothetical protein
LGTRREKKKIAASPGRRSTGLKGNKAIAHESELRHSLMKELEASNFTQRQARGSSKTTGGGEGLYHPSMCHISLGLHAQFVSNKIFYR